MTVLFTDIESSTDRWEDDAAAMATALAAHDTVLDEAIERHGGTRFKHTGDGVCAVFPTPSGAVQAAVEAQGDLRLPVRIGLHTGEVESRDGDFYGPTLNRCARIMDAGHGGQVLVSSATAELLDGVDLVELGAFSLKGIERAVRIHQVGTRDFPPLRARRSSNLPGVSSSLIGREDLVAEVIDVVGDHPIVTLTGVGGVGKTRLALEVAHRAETDFDETFFVGLQEVDDDDGVLEAVGLALDLKTPTLDSLGTALSQRLTLTVFDNCEHVLDGVADVIEHVAAHVEGAHVLTTSREGLSVAGELVIPVPTLDAADHGPAVALFVERARSRDYGFDASAHAETITSICARLDGLPLAIELAAARVGVLPPAELLEHLGDRFRVLTGSRRRRSRDRQRTLEETIDWSYDLLDPADRSAFARLAVFAGSFDAAAATAVLRVDEFDALDHLEVLVDRSLLTIDDHVSGRRYRYLETIRAYAERRLHDAGEGEDSLEALHQHLVSVMPMLVERFREQMKVEAARLELETPNLRRAFDWAIEREDVPAATALIRPFLGLVGVVVWQIHGWADEVVALRSVAGADEEPELLLLQANDRHLDNRFRELRDLSLRALEFDSTPCSLSREAFHVLGYLLNIVGEHEATRTLIEERSAMGVRTWADAVSGWYMAVKDGGPFVDLAAQLESLGEYGHALSCYYEAMREGRSGALRDFHDLRNEALGLFVEDSPYWFGTLQGGMPVALAAGDIAEAVATADFDLDHAYRIGDRSAMIMPLACYAEALRQLGEVETAAIVRGCLPRRLTVHFEDELVELDERLTRELDEAALRELTARGAAMEPRELRDLAHSVIDEQLEQRPGP